MAVFMVQGYIYAIIAAATYGMNPLFALPLYADGMDAISVLFWRYLFAVPMLFILAKIRGRSLKMEKREFFPLIGMGIIFMLSSISLFGSYLYMDSGIASTLLFIYPVMVAMLMWILFKERLNRQTSICMAITLLGIWMLFKNESGATLSLIGILLVMASSLSYSIYIVAINNSFLKDIPTVKVTMYALLAGLVALGGILLFKGEIHSPTKWYLWGDIFAFALLPTVLSLLCTTAAIQRIGPTKTALLGAMEPVTAIFFGVTIFGESISARESVGIVLIIVAVSMVVAGGVVSANLVKFKKLFPKLPKGKK